MIDAQRQKIAKVDTFEEKEKAKSAEEMLHEVLANATPSDVYGEYLHFLKVMPKLLNNAEQELVGQVKEHLKIEKVKKELLEKPGDIINLKGEEYPILDALSIKLGLSLRNILAPPCQTCLLCEKPLVRNHKPTMVPFHTLNGPHLATKYSWECRSCHSIWKFKNTFEKNCRVYYSVDQYGNPDMGYKKYPDSFKVNTVRCSSEEYCSKRFLASYMSHLQHCFTTSEGESEAYNEVFKGTEKEAFFRDFLNFNPDVGGHFEEKASTEKKELVDGEEKGTEEIEKSRGRSTMHELGRKNLTSAYLNHEVFCEMVERGSVESVIFGPKNDPNDPRRKISYKESVEHYMKEVDQLRRGELYSHTAEDCSDACRRRGCGKVVSVDGNWKLSYKICLWRPQNRYSDQNIFEEYPNVCSEEPARGSAFCSSHSQIIEQLEYPTELRKFITKCGADPDAYTKEGKKKVRGVLEKLSKTQDTKSTMSAEDAQGTSYFLRNRQISTKENFQTTDGPDDDCRKDIGILHRLHSWSRGIVEIVGGGGIIEYWAPIFDSEGPVQTLFIILVFLQMKLKGLGEDDYKSFFISYDNMTKRCHNLISQIIAQELRSLPCLVCHWLTL